MLAKQDYPPLPVPGYDSDDEQKRLFLILLAAYLLMLKAVNALVTAHFELDKFPIDEAAAARAITPRLAAHVVRIDETTRRAIAASLEEGARRGYSNWQIAYGVPTEGFGGISGLFKETWKGRAEMVARTELAHAQRDAAVARYLASGLVDRVLITDGCEWDKPCCDRNGKIVPLEQAPTLNHPNCTLLLTPILRQGVASPPSGEAAEQPALL